MITEIQDFELFRALMKDIYVKKKLYLMRSLRHLSSADWERVYMNRAIN